MVCSGFGINPRSLEPKESLLLISVTITLGFLYALNKNQPNKQKSWWAKLVRLPSAMYCLQIKVSVGGRVSCLVTSKEVFPIS